MKTILILTVFLGMAAPQIAIASPRIELAGSREIKKNGTIIETKSWLSGKTIHKVITTKPLNGKAVSEKTTKKASPAFVAAMKRGVEIRSLTQPSIF